jgi:hypothetical protein
VGVQSLHTIISQLPASQKEVEQAKDARKQKNAEVNDATVVEQDIAIKLANTKRELAAAAAVKQSKETDAKALGDDLASKEEKVAMINFYKCMDEDGYSQSYQRLKDLETMTRQFQCIVCKDNTVYNEHGHALAFSCGHVHACAPCIAAIRRNDVYNRHVKCPTCNQYSGTQRVYLFG